jgi:hypothetical protein
VENLYQQFKDKDICFKAIKGTFYYVKSDYKRNFFISEFISDLDHSDDLRKIAYYTYGGVDTLVFNNLKIGLDFFEYDPTSIELYHFTFSDNKYICLLGKSSSASGSGLQQTFYCLFKSEGTHYNVVKMFNTRFGSINNLGDFNGDNCLDYISIIRSGSDYKLSFRNLENKDLCIGYLLMKYKLNNKFQIIESQMLFKGRDLRFPLE